MCRLYWAHESLQQFVIYEGGEIAVVWRYCEVQDQGWDQTSGARGETIEDEPGVGDEIITPELVLIWVMRSRAAALASL